MVRRAGKLGGDRRDEEGGDRRDEEGGDRRDRAGRRSGPAPSSSPRIVICAVRLGPVNAVEAAIAAANAALVATWDSRFSFVVVDDAMVRSLPGGAASPRRMMAAASQGFTDIGRCCLAPGSGEVERKSNCPDRVLVDNNPGRLSSIEDIARATLSLWPQFAGHHVVALDGMVQLMPGAEAHFMHRAQPHALTFLTEFGCAGATAAPHGYISGWDAEGEPLCDEAQILWRRRRTSTLPPRHACIHPRCTQVTHAHWHGLGALPGDACLSKAVMIVGSEASSFSRLYLHLVRTAFPRLAAERVRRGVPLHALIAPKFSHLATGAVVLGLARKQYEAARRRPSHFLSPARFVPALPTEMWNRERTAWHRPGTAVSHVRVWPAATAMTDTVNRAAFLDQLRERGVLVTETGGTESAVDVAAGEEVAGGEAAVEAPVTMARMRGQTVMMCTDARRVSRLYPRAAAVANALLSKMQERGRLIAHSRLV